MEQGQKRMIRALWLGVLAAGMLLPGAIAQAEEGCEGGGGPEPSTAGLAVHVTATSGLRMTAVARVDPAGNPSAVLVLFDPNGLADGGLRVHDFTAHRVALLSDHDTEHVVGNGENDEGIRATVRGAGLLDDGSEVQVWIDVVDRGPKANTDRARIRIRPLPDHDSGEVGDHEDGGCGGGGSGSDGSWDYPWMTVRQVQVSAANE